MELVSIDLPFKSLSGFSEDQFREHYEVLYKGYVNKVNEIRSILDRIIFENGNATYSEIRELKLEESFAINAVKLHEAYFLGLGGDGSVPAKVKEVLVRDFGSIEKFITEFTTIAMSARGWVILFYDWQEARLSIGLSDFHSHGGIWDASPFLVLDVYEHAYFMDFGTKRKEYIEKFFSNLSWKFSEKQLENIEKTKK